MGARSARPPQSNAGKGALGDQRALTKKSTAKRNPRTTVVEHDKKKK